jgi:hypothetical protein
MLLLSACNNKTPLSKEKTVAILADAMRMEATQQVQYNYMVLPDSLWKINYDFLLEKHQVSQADFKTTISYYKQEGKLFAEIMKEVVQILEEENDKNYRR